MRVLITAGTTRLMLDRISYHSSIFTGKTGAAIARTAWDRGHTVTLLTSAPDQMPHIQPKPGSEPRMFTATYQTPDELILQMQHQIKFGNIDTVIHAAATPEYSVAGTYSPTEGTLFNVREKEWEFAERPKMTEHVSARGPADEVELWVRFVRAPRLIERLRPQWGFRGSIVVFRSESGLSDLQLINAAEDARGRAYADFAVANNIETAAHTAFIGPVDGRYERVTRRELAERLMLTLEHLRTMGGGSWHDG